MVLVAVTQTCEFAAMRLRTLGQMVLDGILTATVRSIWDLLAVQAIY